MDFYTDLAVMYPEKGLVLLVSAFVITSYILFAVDLIKAKKEHRKVKLGFKIMLIISLIINVSIRMQTASVICWLLGILLNIAVIFLSIAAACKDERGIPKEVTA